MYHFADQNKAANAPAVSWQSLKKCLRALLLGLSFDPMHSLISKHFFNFMVGIGILNIAVLAVFFLVQ